MSTANTSSPTTGSQGTFEYRDPVSGQLSTVAWEQATEQQIVETAGWKPWLVDLGSPSKLTQAQRRACGLEQLWTCNVRSGRKNCQQTLGAVTQQRREKCEQWSALPPPPVLEVPDPANPQADPGALAAASDQQLAALSYADAYGYPVAGGGQPQLVLDSFVPSYGVDRGQEDYRPAEPEAAAGILGLPTWLVVLAGLAVAYAVTR